MSSQKHKNPDNPFARLDAAAFPEQGQARKKPVPQRKQKATQAEPNADAELFLNAMSQVRSISPREPHPMKDDLGGMEQALAALISPAGKASGRKPVSAGPKAGAASGKIGKDAAALQSPSPAGARFAKDAAPTKGTERATRSAPVSEKAFFEPDDTEELQAFRQAVKDAQPLAGRGRDVPPEPEPAPISLPDSGNPLQDFLDGKVEFALSETDEYVEGHVVGLDQLTVSKLQTRQYSPEAHIDLHGLNSDQAFQNLVYFFKNAYYKGVRTALVVTGRGLNSPYGMPVLRFKIQQWFTQEPFRRVVLAFCTAKQEDGGRGALYVLLRKFRKNSGKVRWDALPNDLESLL